MNWTYGYTQIGIPGFDFSSQGKATKITRPSDTTINFVLGEAQLKKSSGIDVYIASQSGAGGETGITIVTNTTGKNALDTGTLQTNTWYYIWAIFDSTNSELAGVISTSYNFPVLPAGFDYKLRIGTCRTYTDSTTKIRNFLILGNVFVYLDEVLVYQATGLTERSWIEVPSASNYFSPLAKKVTAAMSNNASGAGGSLGLSSLSSGRGGSYFRYSGIVDNEDFDLTTITSRSSWVTHTIPYNLNNDYKMYYYTGNSSMHILAIGWEE